MKKILPLFLLSFLLIAAGGGSLDKLNGNWTCDLAASLALNEKAREAHKQNPKQFEQEVASLGIGFDVKNKKIRLRAGKNERVNTFTYAPGKGGDFTITAGGVTQYFRFTPEGKLVIRGAFAGGDMVFKRAR